MLDTRTQLKRGLSVGAKRGWSSFIWICKIIIPISFLVALLQWTGWLHLADFLLNPLMGIINLPAEAALPIITATMVGLYAALATMAVIPFTIGQMTLIAIFIMIAHGLPMEGMIQRKSGIGIVKITLVRITAAILACLVASQFFSDTGQSVAISANLVVHTPFAEALKAWAANTASLFIKIIVIVMLVMVTLECLKSLGWIKYLLKIAKPFMKILGLSERTATMWIAATVFGLVYGGAVITEEAKNESLTKEELEYLHISIGINHSMVEDPALFLALGLNVFWLMVPRFVTAAIAVHLCRAIRAVNRALPHR